MTRLRAVLIAVVAAALGGGCVSSGAPRARTAPSSKRVGLVAVRNVSNYGISLWLDGNRADLAGNGETVLHARGSGSALVLYSCGWPAGQTSSGLATGCRMISYKAYPGETWDVVNAQPAPRIVLERVASTGGVGSVAEQLLGSWRLVAYEDRPADGPTVFPYGSEPRGLLIYDATGHMAIQIMKTPHPSVASGEEESVAPDEKAALLDAYVAYFGTYRVDAQKGIVVHRAEGDLYDVFIGRDEPRPFRVEGDRLVLSPRWSAKGREWTGLRMFERVKPLADKHRP
jgi:hypothetical protein